MRVTGFDSMMRVLDIVQKNLKKDSLTGLEIEAEKILAISKRDHVPVDSGRLRGSGKVSKPERSGNVARVEISYSGPYAIPVHEHMSRFSPRTWRSGPVKFKPPGRGPKYLERPLMRAKSGLASRIAKRVRLRK